MDYDYTERLLRRFRQSIAVIKNNWQDDIGADYVRWLEDCADKLESYEPYRREMMEREQLIRKYCEEILAEGDKQKVR